MMNLAKAVGRHMKIPMKESFASMLAARDMVMVWETLPPPMLYRQIVGDTASVLQEGEMTHLQVHSELILEIATA